ncbi:MAG: ABC transporter ATP-binding protein/permease [Bacilli bacterium]|nr:ABC transporter ATP-binding protein/permease [Bacilli bacterium]
MNEKKKKYGIFSNFLYALKIVYRLDKTYIYQKIVYTLFASVSAFTYAYIMKVAVAGIEKKTPYKEMLINVLLIIAVAFTVTAVIRVLNRTFWYKGEKISMSLHLQKSIRTLDMDYELLERPETQDTLEKASRYLNNWSGLLGLVNNGFFSIQYIISFIIALSIILTVNGWLVLIVLSLSVFKIIFENKNQKKEKTEFHDKTPPIWRRINYVNNISTNLSIGKDLRIYEMNKFVEEERKRATADFLALFKKNLKRNYILYLVIQIIMILDALFLYGFMAYEVIYHEMSIATFTFMVASVNNLISSLYNLISNNGHVLRNSLETSDYREFMTMQYIKENQTEAIDDDIRQIEFRHVYYSYYMQDGYALKDVSFILKKGEKLALVGYNGAGKTTLVKLLCGLYHPIEGEILINGQNIETLKRENLQRLISPVFQETILYALGIGENVAMASDDYVDDDKLSDVLKLVGLEKKIDSLPNKVKTMITREIDESGIEFSGGENQKLSLARAIYKSAPFFIFDEPTSAMDAISESHMYKNFSEIVRDNAAIYISHRLSSTKFCDRIIFLNNGKIIEEGTHQELMVLNGEYRKLFDTQAEYYKEVESYE